MSVGNNSNDTMVAIGPEIPNFELTDQNKKKINNQEYAGKSICIRISYWSVNLSNE
jgi:peroxiredoxin